MGVTMQYKLGAVLLERARERGCVDEALRGTGQPDDRMMHQHDAKHPLARPKDRRVQRPPRPSLAGRDHVVEHLMVDDVRDEVARHPGLIERRMDAD